MNRRGFIAALAGAFALDPERLLWRRGEKLISIPAPSVPVEETFIGWIRPAFHIENASGNVICGVNLALDEITVTTLQWLKPTLPLDVMYTVSPWTRYAIRDRDSVNGFHARPLVYTGL